MKSTVLSGIALLLAAQIALGAPFKLQPDCKNPQDQMSMNICADDKAKAAQTELDTLYQEILARLANAEERTLLTKAQTAWEDFRLKECAFETAQTYGGSIHRVILSDCMLKLTTERINALRAQRDCKEDDLSCAHEWVTQPAH